MNFDLTESQYLLQETLRRYFRVDFSTSRVRAVFDGPRGSDESLWSFLAEVGVLGVLTPEAYGGMGLELLDVAVAAEVMGSAVAPGPFLEHVLASLAIVLGGSQAQKDRWLPGLAAGELRASLATAEGEAGWDPGAWSLDATGKLTGTKPWVLFADGVDLLVVGTAGGLTVVEAGSSGVTVEPVDGVDRTRRLGTVTLSEVAHDPLPLGGDIAQDVVDAGLVLLAADAFGAARRVLELAVDYANTREQFGVTIGHFQALKHQLADAATDLLPSQGLFWYAAHAYDHAPEDRSRFAALAKAHISERAVSVGRLAVQAHGGVGYTWDADVHFYLKRAIFDRTYLGSPQALRARVADLSQWTNA